MIADSDQQAVLLRLHDQLDEGRSELSASDISGSFEPPIDPLEVEAALAQLIRTGRIISVSQYPTRYRISRAGIIEIETTHDIATTTNPGTGLVHRTYTEKSRPKIHRVTDWTKWGTILTGATIVVSILLAVLV